jgi:hypothetical protein
MGTETKQKMKPGFYKSEVKGRGKMHCSILE